MIRQGVVRAELFGYAGSMSTHESIDLVNAPAAANDIPNATAQASGSSRLFYALWPDHDTCLKLAQLQKKLGGRHTHPNDMHLTLAFAGIKPRERLPVLRAVLRDLPLPEPFDLPLNILGSFSRIKVSWAAPAQTPAPLQTLWGNLACLLDQHGLWWDKKVPFRPHVTLARKVVVDETGLSEPIVWRAARVVLAGSVPGATPGGGAKYRVLASRVLTLAC